MEFEKNVFINCPFDEQYYPLLRPLVFTVIYLGMTPRIALKSIDSGQPRIQKIINLVEESKFAIHDLSRIEAEQIGQYFRLNMPFELGLDVGCRLFKEGKWASKKCLILEKEKYRYQAAISDLSNSDIAVHKDEPEELVTEIRNWLNNVAKLRAVGPSKVWGAFLDFMADNYDTLKEREFSDKDIEKLPINELMNEMHEWVQNKT